MQCRTTWAHGNLIKPWEGNHDNFVRPSLLQPGIIYIDTNYGPRVFKDYTQREEKLAVTLPRPALFVSSHYSCSDEESKLDKNQNLIMILQEFRFWKLIFWPGAVFLLFWCMKSSPYWVKRTPNNKPLSCLICISWQGDKSQLSDIGLLVSQES